MEKKPDYSPPGWLIIQFDSIKLDNERAHKLESMRQRLCAATESPGDHTKFPFLHLNALWIKALDLLLERELELLEEVKKAKS